MEARKIGDLARASGVTVRTLHHYEEIGLLRPARTEAGHRLYGDDEVERLYRIIQLRRLGLSLGEIGRALDDEDCDLADAMRRQLAELDRRLDCTYDGDAASIGSDVDRSEGSCRTRLRTMSRVVSSCSTG